MDGSVGWIFGGCAAGVALAAAAWSWLAAQWKGELAESEVEAVEGALAVMAGAFTFLVAFLVVSVWGAQVERVSVLGEELNLLVRTANQAPYGGLGTNEEFHRTLVDYLHKVKEREVLMVPPPDGDREANQLRNKVLALVDRQLPSMAQDGLRGRQAETFVGTVQDWADSRQSRMTRTYAELNGVYTAVVLTLAALTLFLGALVSRAAGWRGKAARIVGIDLTVAILLGLLFYTAAPAFPRADAAAKIDRIETVLETSWSDPQKNELPDPAKSPAPRP